MVSALRAASNDRSRRVSAGEPAVIGGQPLGPMLKFARNFSPGLAVGPVDPANRVGNAGPLVSLGAP
jgi:hypothetical protein